MVEPDALQLPAVLKIPGVLAMPCVSAKPSALSVLYFLSFVFLPFLVLNVPFISFLCRSFYVLCFATSPCPFCASCVHIDTRDRSVSDVVEYVFYAVPAPVVENVIPAVAYSIRELFPSRWLGARLFFNDVAHDVLRASHLWKPYFIAWRHLAPCAAPLFERCNPASGHVSDCICNDVAPLVVKYVQPAPVVGYVAPALLSPSQHLLPVVEVFNPALASYHVDSTCYSCCPTSGHVSDCIRVLCAAYLRRRSFPLCGDQHLFWVCG